VAGAAVPGRFRGWAGHLHPSRPAGAGVAGPPRRRGRRSARRRVLPGRLRARGGGRVRRLAAARLDAEEGAARVVRGAGGEWAGRGGRGGRREPVRACRGRGRAGAGPPLGRCPAAAGLRPVGARARDRRPAPPRPRPPVRGEPGGGVDRARRPRRRPDRWDLGRAERRRRPAGPRTSLPGFPSASRGAEGAISACGGPRSVASSPSSARSSPAPWPRRRRSPRSWP
jgi:hypothetical protein